MKKIRISLLIFSVLSVISAIISISGFVGYVDRRSSWNICGNIYRSKYSSSYIIAISPKKKKEKGCLRLD